jgi:molybdate transport system substrate-binding protein
VNFVSAGAAQGLVATLAKDAGVEVAGSFGAVGAMREKLLAGEACDVVILTHTQIAELAALGRVDALTSADLGSVPTAVAVRASDAPPGPRDAPWVPGPRDAPWVPGPRDAPWVPEVSAEGPLRAALLAADAIYFPDPAKATAGIHFAKVLDLLGVSGEVAAKLKTFPNGTTAMRAMAQAAGRPIGCTQATEILATDGIRLVAPLPPGFDLETVYTAAVSRDAADPKGAARFVETLTGETSREARSRAGFRGHQIRRARAADEASIRALVSGILADYSIAFDPDGTDGDLFDLDRSYFSKVGNFDVVVAPDGSIAGCCGVMPHGRETCELRKMYLVKDARGHGLGKRLLQRALAFARGRRFLRMELETASVLKEAIALYSAAGFTPLARPLQTRRCDKAFALDL